MGSLWMDVDVALAEVPVNIMPLIDSTDFITREVAIAYNQAGMDLVWNFCTTAGAMTQTAVTPTTGGVHDWAHQGDGMYSIEIPASGGTISNDTEGFGWFTGFATGVLPWRGPVIGFRAAALNNALIDGAYSATRGLAGSALPDAVADAAGGLPISNAGELDLDTQIGTDIDAILTDTNELQGDWTDTGRLDALLDAIKAKTDNLPADPADDSDIDAQLATIAAYLDTEIAAIKAVTDNLPDAGALNDLATILADTGELQTDWVNGGRLDLLIDAIKAKTDNLKDAWNDLAAAAVGDAVLDEVVETLTLRQIKRIELAALAGKTSGGGTTAFTARDYADSKPRITATLDVNGNRTAITLDGD